MPAGGQCYEPGPFFPSIPRHATRVGINRRRNLLLRPDWLVTGGLLFGAVVILCLCVTLLVSVQTQNRYPERYNKSKTVHNSVPRADPVPWIWVAWEGANQSAVSLVAARLPHGRLLIQRFKGDLASEDSPKPASENDRGLYSARSNIVAHTHAHTLHNQSTHWFESQQAILNVT